MIVGSGAKSLVVKALIGGAIWQMKGKPGVPDDVAIEVACHDQFSSFRPFTRPDFRSVYRPDRVSVETVDGTVVESRDDPRASFVSHSRETPWDDLHLAYFSGYAMWNYLNTPFLLTMSGIEEEEVDPWNGDGEEWRRLKVTFPSRIGTHNAEQFHYFDRSGMLKRHDYRAEVLGSNPAGNYATEPKEFSGLILPTKRRVYGLKSDGTPIRDTTFVTIDISDILVL